MENLEKLPLSPQPSSQQQKRRRAINMTGADGKLVFLLMLNYNYLVEFFVIYVNTVNLFFFCPVNGYIFKS